MIWRGILSGRWVGVVVAGLVTTCCAALRGQELPKIICSTTQVADFARQIVGDRWLVESVLSPGQDPHLYRTTPNDVEKVSQAKLCLENGWHLEGNDWMGKLAADAGKPLVACAEGVMPLLLTAGKEELEIKDPHAWFTPQNAAVYVRNILRGIIELDPEHADEYQARAELYLAELRALHVWIVQQVSVIPPGRRVLVTSHDAFRYFCEAYGFRTAAPAGWSTGEEIGGGITPAKRRESLDSIRQFGVKAIFVETSVNPKLIRELAREAGVVVGGKLYSDSMGQAGSAGETYIGMMRENVLTIVNGLKP